MVQNIVGPPRQTLPMLANVLLKAELAFLRIRQTDSKAQIVINHRQADNGMMRRYAAVTDQIRPRTGLCAAYAARSKGDSCDSRPDFWPGRAHRYLDPVSALLVRKENPQRVRPQQPLTEREHFCYGPGSRGTHLSSTRGKRTWSHVENRGLGHKYDISE